MRVALYAFGRLKTAGLRETADYYAKIIRPWVELEEIELKPIAVPDKSPSTRSRIQGQEADLLLGRIDRADARAPIYLLDESGRAQPTSAWAVSVREWESHARSVVFVVGSSLGFHETVRARARGTFSLGPQTLSHELARVVLLEQLYRAWSVTRGHPYHNEGQ